MPVTNFYTVEDEIIGEKTAGSPRIDYLTDALGSVTATVNQSGQVVNTYRYKPFGALLAKTGTGPDASFGWVGTQGYRPTRRRFSDFYVRGRHDDSTTGRWPNSDPIGYLGGDANGYTYVDNNPITSIDPSGLQENYIEPFPSDVDDWCRDLFPGWSGCISPGNLPPLPPSIPCFAALYVRMVRAGVQPQGACAIAGRLCGGIPSGINCNNPPPLPPAPVSTPCPVRTQPGSGKKNGPGINIPPGAAIGGGIALFCLMFPQICVLPELGGIIGIGATGGGGSPPPRGPRGKRQNQPRRQRRVHRKRGHLNLVDFNACMAKNCSQFENPNGLVDKIWWPLFTICVAYCMAVNTKQT